MPGHITSVIGLARGDGWRAKMTAVRPGASADSTGSATSLLIRSTAIALASSGGPMTSRVSAWPARPSGACGVSDALVVWIGGSCPSCPATGTNRVNRPGRTSLASGYSPRAGSTGSACRRTCGSADTRSHACPISRRAASWLWSSAGISASGRGVPAWS